MFHVEQRAFCNQSKEGRRQRLPGDACRTTSKFTAMLGLLGIKRSFHVKQRSFNEEGMRTSRHHQFGIGGRRLAD